MSELPNGAEVSPRGEMEAPHSDNASEAASSPKPDNALVTNMGALLAAAGVLVPAPENDGVAARVPDESRHTGRASRPAISQKQMAPDGKERSGTPPRLKSVPALGTSPTALQDLFLNSMRREAVDCTLYFTDGSQERGQVRAFDTFTLLFENRTAQRVQLVYKHSVARIVPARAPAALFERPPETDRSKGSNRMTDPQSNEKPRSS
jgi:host factor-I protein